MPNPELYINLYRQSSLDYSVIEQYCQYAPAFYKTTKIDLLNYMFYMDGHHKYMFDQEGLVFLLKKVGFKNVRLRKFDPELDLLERDYESIYAEAEK